MKALRAGDRLGAYALIDDFVPRGNSRTSFARRDGREFFIKEFYTPKRPGPSLPEHLKAERSAQCRAFEARQNGIIKALKENCAPGGNIHFPTDFFPFGLMYYQIAPRIDVTTTKTHEIAAAPPKTKAILIHALARAVAVIHKLNLNHADLKPDNILITQSDAGLFVPKVIDFDSAFFSCNPPPSTSGEVAFDQNYMSPELSEYAQDEEDLFPKSDLTCASDVFSLGIIFHEYWIGRRPSYDSRKYSDAATSVRAGVQLRLNPSMPRILAEVVEAMTLNRATERPSLANVIGLLESSRDWFQDDFRRRIEVPVELRFGPGSSAPVRDPPKGKETEARPSAAEAAPAPKIHLGPGFTSKAAEDVEPTVRFGPNMGPKKR
jgi:eukaryotic-like serine/threonine-protein kinase